MSSPIGDMVVRIVGDNSELDKSIDSSQTKLKSFSDTAINLGTKLSLGLTAPIVAAGIASLKSAGQFQMYQASFETMLGSAEKAKATIADMQKMAAATPFELGDLAQAGKVLLQYGVSADTLMSRISMLGDIAQGDANKLGSLTLAFGQMSSTGKLMGQDLLQMINAGFNPLKVISDKTGESMASLKDRMSKGKLGVDEVTNAFISATSAGGQFFGGMEKASKTLPGLISTLHDDVSTLGRSFVEDLMPSVMDTIKGLSSFAQSVTELDAPTKAFIVTMLGFAAAAGPVSLGIGLISKAMIFLAANPVVLAIAGIAALTAVVVSLGVAIDKANMEKLSAEYGKVSEASGISLRNIEMIGDALDRQQNFGPPDFESTKQQVKDIAESLGVTEASVISIGLANTNVTDEYRKQLQTLKDQTIVLSANRDTGGDLELKIKRALEASAKAAEDAKTKEKDLATQRDTIIEAYNAKLKENANLVKAGLMTQEDALKSNNEALTQSAEDISKLGMVSAKTNILLAGAKQVALDNADAIKKENAEKELQIEYDKEYSDLLSGIDTVTEENNKRDIEIASWNEYQDKKMVANKKKAFEDIYSSAWDIANSLVELNKIQAQKEIDSINEVRDAKIEALKKAQQVETDTLEKSHTAQTNALKILLQAETDAFKKKQDDETKAIDNALQQELFDKGLAGAATVDQYKKELDVAISTGDSIKIKEAQDAYDKSVIEKEYADQQTVLKAQQALDDIALKTRQAADEAALKQKQKDDDVALKQKQTDEQAAIEKIASDKTRKLNYDAAMAAYQLNIASTVASGARAVIETFAELGFTPWGIAAAALMSATTIAQLAVIDANKPKLANGGIILPSNGGTDVTVGEAGQAEVVIPLDKLDAMLKTVALNNLNKESYSDKNSNSTKAQANNIFQIGSVIANPSGLRELNRLLSKYSNIETKRVG